MKSRWGGRFRVVEVTPRKGAVFYEVEYSTRSKPREIDWDNFNYGGPRNDGRHPSKAAAEKFADRQYETEDVSRKVVTK